MFKKIVSLIVIAVYLVQSTDICYALRPSAYRIYARSKSQDIDGDQPKSASAGESIDYLARVLQDTRQPREPRLLQMSNPEANLRNKIDALETAIALTQQQQRRISELMSEYYSLERLVHRIKRIHISRGSLKLLNIARGTVCSKVTLKNILRPFIYSDLNIQGLDGASGIDYLSMFGEGDGSFNELFDQNLISMNLESFDAVSGDPGSGFEDTGIAIVYLKDIEQNMNLMTIDVPDQAYLSESLFAFILSQAQKDEVSVPEILTLDGIRILRLQTLMRQGLDQEPLIGLRAKNAFTPREVFMPDKAPSRYIENIVVADSIVEEVRALLPSVRRKIIPASEYFDNNERVKRLGEIRQEISEILSEATQAPKASSSGGEKDSIIKSQFARGARVRMSSIVPRLLSFFMMLPVTVAAAENGASYSFKNILSVTNEYPITISMLLLYMIVGTVNNHLTETRDKNIFAVLLAYGGSFFILLTYGIFGGGPKPLIYVHAVDGYMSIGLAVYTFLTSIITVLKIPLGNDTHLRSYRHKDKNNRKGFFRLNIRIPGIGSCLRALGFNMFGRSRAPNFEIVGAVDPRKKEGKSDGSSLGKEINKADKEGKSGSINKAALGIVFGIINILISIKNVLLSAVLVGFSRDRRISILQALRDVGLYRKLKSFQRSIEGALPGVRSRGKRPRFVVVKGAGLGTQEVDTVSRDSEPNRISDTRSDANDHGSQRRDEEKDELQKLKEHLAAYLFPEAGPAGGGLSHSSDLGDTLGNASGGAASSIAASFALNRVVPGLASKLEDEAKARALKAVLDYKDKMAQALARLDSIESAEDFRRSMQPGLASLRTFTDVVSEHVSPSRAVIMKMQQYITLSGIVSGILRDSSQEKVSTAFRAVNDEFSELLAESSPELSSAFEGFMEELAKLSVQYSDQGPIADINETQAFADAYNKLNQALITEGYYLIIGLPGHQRSSFLFFEILEKDTVQLRGGESITTLVLKPISRSRTSNTIYETESSYKPEVVIFYDTVDLQARRLKDTLDDGIFKMLGRSLRRKVADKCPEIDFTQIDNHCAQIIRDELDGMGLEDIRQAAIAAHKTHGMQHKKDRLDGLVSTPILDSEKPAIEASAFFTQIADSSMSKVLLVDFLEQAFMARLTSFMINSEHMRAVNEYIIPELFPDMVTDLADNAIGEVAKIEKILSKLKTLDRAELSEKARQASRRLRVQLAQKASSSGIKNDELAISLAGKNEQGEDEVVLSISDSVPRFGNMGSRNRVLNIIDSEA